MYQANTDASHSQACDEREGTTSLHRAAYGGHVGAVEALLSAGASLEATSRRNGATPLHLAARASRAEVVVRLLNAGARLEQRNRRGESALCVASDPLTIRSLLDPTLLPHTADAAALARQQLVRDSAQGVGAAAAAALPAAAAAVAAAAAAVVSTQSSHAAAGPATPGSESDDTVEACAGGLPPPQHPFLKLRPATALFFERALEEARKRVDTNLGVFPYDLLSHDERILTLAKVAVCLAGYGACEPTAVTESALFNVFACARERVEAEAEAAVAAAAAEAAAAHSSQPPAPAPPAGASADAAKRQLPPPPPPPPQGGDKAASAQAVALPLAPTAKSGEVWRLLLAGAFTEEWGSERCGAYELLGGGGGVPLRREAWGTIVDMVAERAVFGRDAYGIKKALFLERDPIQQRLLYTQLLGGSAGLDSNSPNPQPLRWFPPRPPPATDAELGEAERQVAALTPKGRDLLQGLFPNDHFASKMTMRQLVFSVEGAYSSYCACDSCMRCRNAVERLHKQTVGGGRAAAAAAADKALPKGGAGEHHHNGSRAAADKAAGDKAALALAAAPPALTLANSTPSAIVAAAAAAAAATGGVPDEGSFSAVAWAAVCSASKEITKFFNALSLPQRRDSLQLPAAELDRSMAMSRDWDILVTAELDYDYGGGKHALVEYDSAKDCFLPGPVLAEGPKGAQALLSSLDPATAREAAAWRDPRSAAAAAAAAATPPAAAASSAVVAGGASAGAAPPAECATRALTLYGRRMLELHFTRLFAVRLLNRYGEAARASAAQEALEELLREEESAAARNASKAARKKEKERAKTREREEAAATQRAAAAAARDAEEEAAAAQAAAVEAKAAAQRKARADAEAKAEAEYETLRLESLARAAARADAERSTAAAADGADGAPKSRRKRGKKGAATDKAAAPPAAPPVAAPAEAPPPPPPAAASASARNEADFEAQMLARAIKESLADEAARKARADTSPANAPAMRPPMMRPAQQQQAATAPVKPPIAAMPQSQLHARAQPQMYSAMPLPPLPPLPPPPPVPAMPHWAAVPLRAPSPPIPPQMHPQMAPLRQMVPPSMAPLPPLPPLPPGPPPGHAFARDAFSQPPASAMQPPHGGGAHWGGVSSVSAMPSWSSGGVGGGVGRPSGSVLLDAPSSPSSSLWSGGAAAADELARLRLGGAHGDSDGGWGGSLGGLGGLGSPPLSQPLLQHQLSGTDLSVSAAPYAPPAYAAANGVQQQQHGNGNGVRELAPLGARGVSAAAAAAAAAAERQAAVDAVTASVIGGPSRGLDAPLPFTDGAMFVCTKFTQEECLRRRLLGLPRRDLDLVAACQPGRTALFLFNFSSRELHGLFVAASPGRLNWDGDAWKRSLYHRPGSSRAGAGTSPFPSQVKFRWVKEFSPLHEDTFAHMIRSSNRVTSLDQGQVKELIRLFVKHDTLNAPANPRAFSRETDGPPHSGGAAGHAAIGGGLREPRERYGDRPGRPYHRTPYVNDHSVHQQLAAAAQVMRGNGTQAFSGSDSGGAYSTHQQHPRGCGLPVPSEEDADADAHAAAAAAASVEMLFDFEDSGGFSLGEGLDGGHDGMMGGHGGLGDEEGLCVVCLEQPQDCVLQPCGHQAFCYTCVADLSNCPLCRERVLRVTPQ